MPGAHKIGAAISGPRITGGNFMDTTLFLVDVSDIFYFFLFRGGGRGRRRPRRWPGVRFFIKSTGRGGGSEEDAQEGEGRQGECLWGGGGG